MRGFRLTAAAAAALLLSAGPAAAALSFFDLVSGGEAIAGPPYPTTCHRADVAHAASGIYERDGELAIGVQHALRTEGGHIGVVLRASDNDSTGHSFCENTGFTAVLARDEEPPPMDIRLTFLLELRGADGTPGTLVALQADRHVCDPLRYFGVHEHGCSAEVLCQVEFARGVRHELRFRAELPSGVALTDVSLGVLPHRVSLDGRSDAAVAETYFTARPNALFVVRLGFVDDSGVDRSELVTSMTVSGRFLGGTSPVEPESWGAIKSLFRN
jgi:hypothetical protein